MDDNKNLILAVVLMLVVWLGFSFFFPTKPQLPATASPQPASVAKPTTSQPVVTPATVPAGDQQPVPNERLVRVETDHFRAILTSTGGRISHLELKDYRLSADLSSPPVVMVDAPSTKLATLRLDGQGDFAVPPDIAFALQGDVTDIKLAGATEQSLVFRAVLPSGLVVERHFRFQGQSYGIDLETRILNGSNRELHGQIGVALLHPWDEQSANRQPEFTGSFALVADDIEEETPADLQKNPVLYEQNLVWSGFKDKYFLSVLVPESDKLKGELRATATALESRQFSSVVDLRPGEVLQQKHLAYFGPLEIDILQGLGRQLERAVDFGFFKILAKPLFDVLRFFYTFLGNYGLAIILLTVIIKLLFWPLTQKSYSSMKAMQKLQPEMQKLREKYKNDRERMNREVMELYKNHRVNPLGGCLPMLVQIPVFFALYQVLMVAIELRQAPFYFWIDDLALKDPYYITPLVMGATMFIQQKMTPTAGIDPIQAKIFLFMPIIFTVMFLNFPSGLVIYWLINNLLTILQQFLINRKAS